LAIGICVLDAAMVNVALPNISSSLGVPAATAVWVVNAYGLTVAITLLPFASVAERLGFKLMFRIGLITFMVGAMASALAPSIDWLILWRVIQGLGASCIMCLFGGLMRHVYPLKLLSRGIALNAMNVAVNSVMGPTISSAILSFATWRWVFVAVLPLVFLAALVMRHLPEVPRINTRFDYKAAALSAAAIGLFVMGLDWLATQPLRAFSAMLAGVLIAAWVLHHCSGQTRPLVPVDLFKIAAIRSALAASVSSFAAQMATFVALPFYLYSTYGHEPMTVGLLMACWPLGAVIMAAVAARLAERVEVAILCAIGAGAMAAGSLSILLLPSSASTPWLMAAMMLGGLGFGFFQTPNNRALLGAAARERAGAVGGLQAVTRVFGQTVGAALVASAFATSEQWGPSIGLLVGTSFALIALAVNIRRYRQARARAIIETTK